MAFGWRPHRGATDGTAGNKGWIPHLSAGVRSGAKALSYIGLVQAATPPPSKSQPLSVGIFFARSPCENRNGVASVASAAERLPARFPQIPLSVISRDAAARDATSRIFNDLQAAGSISNLVGGWGIENAWTVYLLLITWSRYR